MDTLIEGYRRFRDSYFGSHRHLFEELAAGQSPKAMIVSCCDSRVDPHLIFNAQPGDVFTLRNIANLVPPYAPDGAHHSTSAALEYAVKVLEVEHIVVMGHSGCGGVRALLEPQDGEFVGPWVKIAEAVRRKVDGRADLTRVERLRLCEHEVIRVSLANLTGYPWISERIVAGRLVLHGWYFDIEAGRLYIRDADDDRFFPV
ncbi:MAG: carbonic anhydrase [Phyllobacteriaceae bacterium]|nr:carbonic anhydrase [Phyllobacteriaceae bacterium]